ncbi:MAG: redoxin family protein [Luteitalea sp.]|nr:redoxin family protein [Luteitalea sp.]
MIKVGDKLPGGTLKTLTTEGPKDSAVNDIFDGKKVVLFGVPGAFTGVCTKQHLPTYVQQYDALKAKGVDTVACLAVNDVFVLDGWSKAGAADGKVLMLSDWNADYVKKIGTEFDGSGFGLGTRSKRFSMVVDNGVVRSLNVEEAPGQCTITKADDVLTQL